MGFVARLCQPITSPKGRYAALHLREPLGVLRLGSLQRLGSQRRGASRNRQLGFPRWPIQGLILSSDICRDALAGFEGPGRHPLQTRHAEPRSHLCTCPVYRTAHRRLRKFSKLSLRQEKMLDLVRSRGLEPQARSSLATILRLRFTETLFTTAGALGALRQLASVSATTVFHWCICVAPRTLVVEGTFCVECLERLIALIGPGPLGSLCPDSGRSGGSLRRQSRANNGPFWIRLSW
jgi:hypothetical protein